MELGNGLEWGPQQVGFTEFFKIESQDLHGKYGNHRSYMGDVQKSQVELLEGIPFNMYA